MKHKPKLRFKVGDVLTIPVEQDHINDSDPCNKDNCMVNRAFLAWYSQTYGHANSRAKATNHGLTFQLEGRRYTVVFDHRTGNRIFGYDQCYINTRSKDQARKSVRPFKVRLVFEASVAVVKWPSMSEETKEKLRDHKGIKKPKVVRYKPKNYSNGRQLSL